jgi:hypothetical protein
MHNNMYLFQFNIVLLCPEIKHNLIICIYTYNLQKNLLMKMFTNKSSPILITVILIILRWLVRKKVLFVHNSSQHKNIVQLCLLKLLIFFPLPSASKQIKTDFDLITNSLNFCVYRQ